MLAFPDIRLATSAQARDIARMSRDCIEHGLGWSWTVPRVTHALRDPATNVVVACKCGLLLGFGVMQYRDNSAHLALLAVQPVMRHQGLGRQLVDWLERSARIAGISTIGLECRADNRNAIAFYQRLGYRQVGSSVGYYDGRIDAARLEKSLT